MKKLATVVVWGVLATLSLSASMLYVGALGYDYAILKQISDRKNRIERIRSNDIIFQFSSLRQKYYKEVGRLQGELDSLRSECIF